MKQTTELLTSVNLSSPLFALRRVDIKHYSSKTAMIYNFRTLIRTLGYDCSLLTDGEILALEDAIAMHEQEPEDSELLEILNFLTTSIAG